MRKRYSIFHPTRFLLPLALLLNCVYFTVYYNLFYNAKVFFKEGKRLAQTNPTLAKEKFTKAKEKALLTIKKYPRSRYVPEALFIAASAHYYLKEYEKAKERFSLFLSLYPKHKLAAEATYFNALASLESEDFATGIFLLRTLAKEDKREAKRARYKIYSSLLERSLPVSGRESEVRLVAESLVQFIADYPKTSEAREAKFLLADAYFILKDYPASRKYYTEYFQDVVDKEKKARTLLKIGETLLKMAAPKETLRGFIAQLPWIEENHPALKSQALLLKGKILFALEDDESAISILKQVKGGDVGAESYFLIGEYYEKRGDFKNALIYYDSARIFSDRQEFGIMAGKRKVLLERFAKEETLSPAERNFALGELYFLSLAKPEAAVKEYEKVFTLYPDDSLAPKSLYAAAWIKKFLLQEASGDSLFRELLRRYPNTEYAKEGERILKGSE